MASHLGYVRHATRKVQVRRTILENGSFTIQLGLFSSFSSSAYVLVVAEAEVFAVSWGLNNSTTLFGLITKAAARGIYSTQSA